METNSADNEPGDALVEWSKHVEEMNVKLFDAIHFYKERNEKYRSALERIRDACRGCPAYDMAQEALDDGEDEEEIW